MCIGPWIYTSVCMRVCVCVERFFVPLLFCEKPLMHDITVSLSLSHMSAMSVCGKQLCVIILHWDKRYRTVAWSIWPTEFTAVDSLQSVNADFLGQLIIRKASATVSVSLSIGRGSCKASIQTFPYSLLLVWQPRASDGVIIIYVSRGDLLSLLLQYINLFSAYSAQCHRAGVSFKHSMHSFEWSQLVAAVGVPLKGSSGKKVEGSTFVAMQMQSGKALYFIIPIHFFVTWTLHSYCSPCDCCFER